MLEEKVPVVEANEVCTESAIENEKLAIGTSIDEDYGIISAPATAQPTTAERILKATGLLLSIAAVVFLIELLCSQPSSWDFVQANVHLCLSAAVSGIFHTVLMTRTLIYGRAPGRQPWWVSAMFIVLYVCCTTLHAWVAMDSAAAYFDSGYQSTATRSIFEILTEAKMDFVGRVQGWNVEVAHFALPCGAK